MLMIIMTDLKIHDDREPRLGVLTQLFRSSQHLRHSFITLTLVLTLTLGQMYIN